MLDTLQQDIRYALRTLRRAPGFTIAAVATLALGIGATALVFSMVNTVLLKPFPYPDPHRLVAIDEKDTVKGDDHVSSSYLNFVDWRTKSRSFDGVSAYTERSISMRGDEAAELLQGVQVSANLFRTLGVTPIIGRDFAEAEDVPGGAKVVMLSHELWLARFGGDREVVGRTVYLNAEPHTVVGVMPQGFQFPSTAQAWVPLQLGASEDRGMRYLDVVARLRDGVTIEQANTELTGISEALAQEYEGANGAHVAAAENLHAATMRNIRPILLILFGAVGFVLLIACANVANLMLARAATRDREMAIRGAIGAGSGRLVRQLLTESLVIALLGAGAGALLGAWWLDLLVSRLPGDLPYWMTFRIDRTVLAFTAGTAVLTALVFGLAPAVQAGRADLHGSLKEGARATDGVRRARLRSMFVVAQLAAAIVLLVGGFLMTRSFLAMRQVHPGFDQDGIVTMRIELPAARYADDQSIITAQNLVVRELEALPGVAAAALVSWFPISGSSSSSNFSIDGVGEIENMNAFHEAVTSGYFEAMGIPVLRGRAFDRRDRAGSPPVIIINQKMADLYFEGRDPVGRGIMLGASTDPEYATIVGVVGNVNQRDVDQAEIGVDIYTPMEQTPRSSAALVVRASPMTPALIRLVQDRMHAIDSDIPLFDVETVQELIRNATWDSRLTGSMFSLFALGATLLAVIGLYGVVSYGVQQRSHEISVRVALGATKDHVLGMVFRQGLRLTALGVAAGMAAAFALSRVLGNVLFGVSSTDPVTFIAVPALLAAVALVAMYVPARRAARLDPIAALRGE